MAKHQIRITLAVLCALALVGCAAHELGDSASTQLDSMTSSGSTSNVATNEQPDIADCGYVTFEDWPTWTRVNEYLILSTAHSNNLVDIHVNDLAAETYLSAGALYTECSVVVKATYRGTEGDNVVGLGVMVKMPAGYDPDNGDWWYGRLHTSGRHAIEEGRLEECIRCHKLAFETDYMYSKEVLQSLYK